MNQSPVRRPTLKQVAEVAGYSSSTVSRALREDPRVALTTREHIQDTASDLGFTRNTSASSLRSGGASSALVGLLIPDFHDPFFAAVAAGVQEAAANQQLEVIIGCHNNSTNDQERLVRQMASHRVEAIIIAPAPGPPPAQLVTEMQFGTTVVSVDRPAQELGCDLVTTENVDGTRLLVGELLRRGHRRIGVVSLEMCIWTQGVRLRAVMDMLAESGIELDPAAVISADRDGTIPRENLDHLLLNQDVTAVLGLSVMPIVQALAAAMRLDIELDWACFDGHPLFDLLDTRIFCVEQDAAELGRAAIGRLIEHQENRGVEATDILVPLRRPVARGRRWRQ